MRPTSNWARKAIGSNGHQAAGLPTRGSTQNVAAQTLAVRQYMQGTSLGRALPAPDAIFQNGLFTPNTPTSPWPVDNQRPGQVGGPTPRIFQYPVGYNLPTGPRTYEPVSFDTLRMVGKQIEPARAAIQLIKNEVLNADWSIKVRDPNLARLEGRDYKKDAKKKITQYFRHPDPLRGSNFTAWGKMVLEEALVTDALSIYPRHRVNGELAALQILDGATIKPLVDMQGGRPQDPYPAFQQYLYGVPRSEFAAYGNPAMLSDRFDLEVPAGRNMRASQLIYMPMVQSANSVYGFPPTEQVLQTAVTYLRRATFWQNYFVEGDIPAAFVMGGENWTPEQLERWESALHSLMAGDPTFRHRLKAVPYGTDVKEMKTPNFEVAFDEFLLKIVAMDFGVTSNELFGLSSSSGLGGRGFLEEQTSQNERKSIYNYRRTLEEIADDIIANEFGETDLCLRFDERDMVDRLKQAQIDDVNLKNGSTFIDEVREDRGVGSLDMREATIPHIETRAGLTALDKIDEFNDLLLQQGAPGAGGISSGGGNLSSGTGRQGDTNPSTHPGPKEGSPSAAKAAVEEISQFTKFALSSRGGTREFDFRVLPRDIGVLLEKIARGIPVGPDSSYAPHDGASIDLGKLEAGLEKLTESVSVLRQQPPQVVIHTTNEVQPPTTVVNTPPTVLKTTDVEYGPDGQIVRLIDREIQPE